ncbi:MAG: hypothetical protein ACKOCN_03505 [Planctomycetaceae bacterium]
MRRFGIQRPESLESRRVLAAVATIFDVDGDLATIRSSRGQFSDLVGAITSFSSGAGNQLSRIDLSSPVFAGTKLQISITQRDPSGDGIINIGEILAPHDLSSVTVAGDLGRIDVGDFNPATPGIGRLSLGSMGVLSTTTGATDLNSIVRGSIRSLQIQTDVSGVTFTSTGNLGNAVVGGSIIGVKSNDGFTVASIGTMTVAGSLLGGGMSLSGQIQTTSGAIRSLRIGEIIGGAGDGSGTVFGATGIKDIRINGSVVGGTNVFSGGIAAGVAGGIGKLTITGNLQGGSFDDTGFVATEGRIKSATIGGALIAYTGERSGIIEGRNGIDRIRIGGGIIGGSDRLSGAVLASNGSIRRMDVNSAFGFSAITGGAGQLSGSIIAGNLGSVMIRGDVVGLVSNPVLISAVGAVGRAIGSLTVSGRVENTRVLAGYASEIPLNGNARIGEVVVRGDLVASSIAAGIDNSLGTGQFGNVFDIPIGGSGTSRIDSVTVGGSAIGNVNLSDAFGIAAMTIGRVRIGGTRYSITEGSPSSPFADNFALHDVL